MTLTLSPTDLPPLLALLRPHLPPPAAEMLKSVALVEGAVRVRLDVPGAGELEVKVELRAAEG